MSKDLWMIFYVTYGVAGLLMLAMLIQGVVKKHPMKKIVGDLGRPLVMIMLSLALWYGTVYISGDFFGRF
ncbi:hypothetical protein D8Y20_11990 [Mariprofundus sp. EBB-1]|uniref:hypothetical protein n=1 Tax=Mariprofundus sp. EBB-1 TaxID=2650971 RepID=UPI000EF2560E|nr:hypothetical protein [Mariprofundus sp. EBB-1]RLL50459.1 hypothetical protein D8Y20_11990 [Mariprofundus sp. EBB-1]